MKTKLATFGLCAAMCLGGQVFAETTLRISTAQGNGADTTISSASPSGDLGKDENLSLQYSLRDNQSQKILLKFDTRQLTNMSVQKAFLTLQPLSGYHGTYEFNVFGVRENSGQENAFNEQWTDKGSKGLTWETVSVHNTRLGGGYWETREEKKKVEGGELEIETIIVNAAGVDPDQVTYLGRFSVRPRNNRCRLLGDDLARFINSDKNGSVTLLITRATPNPAPITFASSENPFFDPPQLQLTVQPNYDVMAPISSLVTYPISINGADTTIELFHIKASVKAFRNGWIDSLEDMEKMVAFLKTDQPADSQAAAAQALGNMLLAEASYCAMELTDEEWLDVMKESLQNNPKRSGDILYAFMMLASYRVGPDVTPENHQVKLKPFLEFELPAAARSNLIEWLVDIEEPAKSGKPEDMLAHYRQHIPKAFGIQSEPYVLIQYVDALSKVEGVPAATAFLDQLMSILADDSLGPAAALLRISSEAETSSKDALTIKLVEEQPNSKLASVLMPYYFAAKNRQGKIKEAFDAVGASKALEQAKTDEQKADLVYQTIAKISVSENQLERFPRESLGNLKLGEVMTPLEACTALAEYHFDKEEYKPAAIAALSAVRNIPISMPRLDDWNKKVTAISDFKATDNTDELKSVAGLLIARCYEKMGEERQSRKWLRVAEKAAPATTIKAYVLYQRAKQDAEGGRVSRVDKYLDEAATLFPNSPVFAKMADIAKKTEPQEWSEVVVEKKLQEALSKAKKTEDAAAAEKAYLEAADLAVRIGHTEEAISAYQALCEKNEKSEHAPSCMANCVFLLEQQNRKESTKRAEAMRKTMVEKFGQEKVDQLIAQASKMYYGS